ncbi:ABC transporter substrate-binding protein [Psychrobacillus vulpis]|uniref:DNA-binding protein n=1 Tax=Psychrobacillus vulpis TaxID=2325572 RepID=A0A544TSX4_9BACI|nr:ABC transporter substrate-binding protein [Psychrobacillus vulpis]TQR20552.1 DNA-binding protein [Psychrobacillus vulpis]
MRENKKWLMLVLMMFCVLMISACSSEGGNVDGEKAQEIKVRINDDPDFLDPHLATASISYQMILNMFEGLFAPETDGSLSPAIAESYELSEDGLTYTFNIRDNVKFHNGNTVKVEDITYTFDRLMGTKNGDPLSSNFNNVASIEAPDTDTFVIKLKEPNSNFLYSLTALQSAIIPASNEGKHNDNPIGTGPFKFVKYSPGANLELAKHEDYWDEKLPYLDKVTFVFQSDDQSALMALKAKEVDLTGVPANRLAEVENDFNIRKQNNNSTLVVTFNQEREPFKDVRVRQAINYAINKGDIIDAVFSGYATPIGSNMSPAMGDYYKDGLQDVYARNIEKAKELLAEAGYPDGFSTKISVSSHNDMYSNIAQVIVENLREIGIKVEIEVVEWGIWLERIYFGRDYDMTTIDLTGRPSAYEILNDYISTNDSENFFRFKNAEFDKIMADVLKEADRDKQIQMYQRAQEILNEDSASVYIADYQVLWASDKEIEGLKSYPFWFHDMSEVRFTE